MSYLKPRELSHPKDESESPVSHSFLEKQNTDSCPLASLIQQLLSLCLYSGTPSKVSEQQVACYYSLRDTEGGSCTPIQGRLSGLGELPEGPYPFRSAAECLFKFKSLSSPSWNLLFFLPFPRPPPKKSQTAYQKTHQLLAKRNTVFTS